MRTPMRRASAGSTANQHCRYRVQRLRAGESAIPAPGSQGLDPRTLRPERLKWLRDFAKSEPAAQIAAFPNTWRKPSGSRRTATGVCLQTPRAVPCGLKWKDHCQPFHTPHAEVLRASEASKHGQVMGGFALRGPLTGAPQGEGQCISTRRAFAHYKTTTTFSTAARAKARQGHTLPPLFFPTVSR